MQYRLKLISMVFVFARLVGIGIAQDPSSLHLPPLSISLEFEDTSSESKTGRWTFDRDFFSWGEFKSTGGQSYFYSVSVRTCNPKDPLEWELNISERMSFDGDEHGLGELSAQTKASRHLQRPVRSISEAKSVAEMLSDELPEPYVVFDADTDSSKFFRNLLPIIPDLFLRPAPGQIPEKFGDKWRVTARTLGGRTVHIFDPIIGFVVHVESEIPASKVRPKSKSVGRLTAIANNEYEWNSEGTFGDLRSKSTIRFNNIESAFHGPIKLKARISDGDNVELLDSPQIRAVWKDNKIVKVADNEEAMKLANARMNRGVRLPYLLVITGILVVLIALVRRLRQQ